MPRAKKADKQSTGGAKKVTKKASKATKAAAAKVEEPTPVQAAPVKETPAAPEVVSSSRASPISWLSFSP